MPKILPKYCNGNCSKQIWPSQQNEKLLHTEQNVLSALIFKKKKRKKPKRLNLQGDEASSIPQSYGLEEVEKAREFQAGKAAREEQEKAEKAAKKIKDAEDREAKKHTKAAEKMAKAEKKEADCQVARRAKAQAKIEAAEV